MSKNTGKHMASGSHFKGGTPRDNYTYEQDSQRFEDVSSYSSAKRKAADQRELERQRSPKKKHTVVKVIVAVVLVLAAAAGAGAYYLQGYLLKDLTVKPITKDREELGIHSELMVNSDTSIKNIALLGLDARNSESDGVRSDVMMIVTVDNKHGKIKMTSVLRDSNVSIRMNSDEGGYYYFDDKITHAYHYGGEELAIQTLNRNFFLNIEDYVTVNFAQTAQIVDAVGGVDIDLSAGEVRHLNLNLWSLYSEVEEQKDYDREDGTYASNTYPEITRLDFFENIYGEVNLYSSEDEYEGGRFHLNGNQAVAYARIRYLDSDDVRASRQQNVIKALLNQVRGKSKLEYPEMIRQIMPLCATSLEFDDIVSMIPILLTDFTIETMSVPGEADHADGGQNSLGGWAYFYDLEQAAREINDFIYESDAPAVINVDEDVVRVSDIYRMGNYASYSGDVIPDEDTNWEPPADLPSYIPSDEPVSEPEEPSETDDPPYEDPSSGGESWEEPDPGGWEEPDPEPEPGGEDTGGWDEPTEDTGGGEEWTEE